MAFLRRDKDGRAAVLRRYVNVGAGFLQQVAHNIKVAHLCCCVQGIAAVSAHRVDLGGEGREVADDVEMAQLRRDNEWRGAIFQPRVRQAGTRLLDKDAACLCVAGPGRGAQRRLVKCLFGVVDVGPHANDGCTQESVIGSGNGLHDAATLDGPASLLPFARHRGGAGYRGC